MGLLLQIILNSRVPCFPVLGEYCCAICSVLNVSLKLFPIYATAFSSNSTVKTKKVSFFKPHVLQVQAEDNNSPETGGVFQIP